MLNIDRNSPKAFQIDKFDDDQSWSFRGFTKYAIERWRVFLFCFIGVVGIIVGAWAVLARPVYTSTALVSLHSIEAAGSYKALMLSPLVIDAAIDKLGISYASRDLARRSIANEINIAPAPGEDKKEPIVHLVTFRSSDARQAQAVLAEVLNTFLAKTRPGPETSRRIQARAEEKKAQLKKLNDIIIRYDQESEKIITPNSISGEIATPLYNLEIAKKGLEQNIIDMENSLEGLNSDSIVSPPTTPDEALRPINALLIAIIAFCSGLAMAALVIGASFALRHFRAYVRS